MITDINRLPDEMESAFVCCDCMELMRRYPDQYFDIAVVDPPYGINMGHTFGVGRGGYDRAFGGQNTGLRSCQERKNKAKFYHTFDDSAAPDEKYFDELKRVSKAQIIWGGNYFLDYLGRASCIIVWDKKRRGMDQADCEIAWTSLPGQSRIFEFRWNGMLQQDMKHKEKRIHPTQKPVALYKWIIEKFTKPSDIILDTHVGSASSLIAAKRLRRRFVGCEKDELYFNQALNRFNQETAQLSLMDLISQKEGETNEYEL